MSSSIFLLICYFLKEFKEVKQSFTVIFLGFSASDICSSMFLSISSEMDSLNCPDLAIYWLKIKKTRFFTLSNKSRKHFERVLTVSFTLMSWSSNIFALSGFTNLILFTIFLNKLAPFSMATSFFGIRIQNWHKHWIFHVFSLPVSVSFAFFPFIIFTFFLPPFFPGFLWSFSGLPLIAISQQKQRIRFEKG